MGTLEEVKTMQGQGLPEDQIIQTLQDKGVPYREISESLAQSKIKAAIEEPAKDPTAGTLQAPPGLEATQQSSLQGLPQDQGQLPQSLEMPQTPSQELQAPPAPQDTLQAPLPAPEPVSQDAPPQPMQDPYTQQSKEQPEGIPGMQQSIMQSDPDAQPTQDYMPTPAPQEQYTNSGYDQYAQYDQQAGDYQQYDYPQTGVSTDTISEISEQIVAEKLLEMRKPLEKVLDFKTTVEAKTEALDERLRRIEKIIDTLQSSVLRKVGDYVTNVDDIKQELIQTQKTFAKLTGKKTTAKKTAKKKKD